MSIRIAACLLFSVAAVAGLSGCVLFEPESKQTPETFTEALQVCRMQQPGRANRRVHLPPTHAGVAGCLQRRGWNPDGSRIPQ
ncbi:MAG TPA: hypothetical protein PKE27_21875 [Povalibacter sp.]|jgi:hypothetical protein|nr:hypothetical protein [Povalibacter sp.]